jgi:hypothetical protein
MNCNSILYLSILLHFYNIHIKFYIKLLHKIFILQFRLLCNTLLIWFYSSRHVSALIGHLQAFHFFWLKLLLVLPFVILHCRRSAMRWRRSNVYTKNGRNSKRRARVIKKPTTKQGNRRDAVRKIMTKNF